MLDHGSIVKFINEFLQSHCGKEKLDQNHRGGMPLLQIACMGNPEKTIQCELFYFLRTKGINCLMETGLKLQAHGKANKHLRSIDILIMNDEHLPVIAIELKHFSANQGPISTLFKNMDKDFDKRVKRLDLIQIGLYTTIEKILVKESLRISSNDFEFYRFISSYVLKRNDYYRNKPITNTEGNIEINKPTKVIQANARSSYRDSEIFGGAFQSFIHKPYEIQGNIQYVFACTKT